MSNKIERRIIAGALSLRAAGDDGPGTLEGYAAVYSSRSNDLGGFVEQIQPGAFNNVVASKPDVRCLMNHDANLVLGRTKNGTLKLRADSKGLWFSCLLPDTSTGRDLHALISRGDISQCSFAFRLDDGDDDWTEETDRTTGKKQAVRTIKNISHLYDVSSVTTPAYDDTSVSARNLAAHYHITAPPSVLVDSEDRDWLLRENSRKLGQQIAAEDRAAYQSDVDKFNRPHESPYPWERNR